MELTEKKVLTKLKKVNVDGSTRRRLENKLDLPAYSLMYLEMDLYTQVTKYYTKKKKDYLRILTSEYTSNQKNYNFDESLAKFVDYIKGVKNENN